VTLVLFCTKTDILWIQRRSLSTNWSNKHRQELMYSGWYTTLNCILCGQNSNSNTEYSDICTDPIVFWLSYCGASVLFCFLPSVLLGYCGAKIKTAIGLDRCTVHILIFWDSYFGGGYVNIFVKGAVGYNWSFQRLLSSVVQWYLG
jgi:hypothetical protein